MIFTFPHDPNSTNEALFQNTKLELSPGITVLVGCNGSGKSTLLHLIERHCLENEIPCFSFDNKSQGGTHAMSAAEWGGDVDSLTRLAFHSEGEQISACLGNTARAIGRKVRSLQDGDTLFVLLDACDSGFSIDNILELKSLLHLIFDNTAEKNITTYILISANFYETTRNERCLDVSTFKTLTFKTYDAYHDFILKSRQYKDSRYTK